VPIILNYHLIHLFQLKIICFLKVGKLRRDEETQSSSSASVSQVQDGGDCSMNWSISNVSDRESITDLNIEDLEILSLLQGDGCEGQSDEGNAMLEDINMVSDESFNHFISENCKSRDEAHPPPKPPTPPPLPLVSLRASLLNQKSLDEPIKLVVSNLFITWSCLKFYGL